MNTSVFELLGKLAAGAGASQPNAATAAVTGPLAPLLTVLPTEDDCVLYGQEKPILFFYEPHDAAAGTAAAKDSSSKDNLSSHLTGAVGQRPVSRPPPPASSTPSSVTSSSPTPATNTTATTTPAPSPMWPAELTTALLAAPTTAIQALCVTAAEDDVSTRLPNSEVWAEWPQTLNGWQLCPMSHLCAVVRGRTAKSVNGSATATPAAGPGSGGLATFYLLASRYELVGTSAVYERYLLLRPSTSHGVKAWGPETSAATTATTSISVRELRRLRRVTCLCRCFCTAGFEVQPRPSSQARRAAAAAAPPAPPADYFLRLVPTSLQYTFCFTTTALLSVAEEERCQAWAMATAQLHQPGGKAGCGSGGSGWLPRRSCSTEAANTSGALSDGGHTVYQDSTFSRERSTSAVRLEDGAALLGYREDPRSTTSTPARPVAVSRLDEQQQQHHQAHDAHDKRDALECSQEGELERRLPQSQRWRALSLLRLVDTSYYDAQVPAGWRRWRYASSGILCRPLVVDSLDGIVRYIHGSRLAFYTAVAFLDRFIASTVDPVANFQAYRRQILRARTGQEMDFTMMAGSGLGGPGSSDLHDGSAFRAHGAGCGGGGRAAADAHTAQQQQQLFSDDVHARDICGFLTQVIVVCIMLGSKTVDLYPPRIRQLMGCVEDTAPISEQEFVILELHVLLTLGFPVHPVTLFESINALLTFSTSDGLIATLTASHTTRRLLEEYQDRGHLVDDVDKLLREQAERDAASAVHGSGVSVRHAPSHGQSGEAIAAAAKAASSGGHHPHARPTAALTRVDRQAMNDWLRLRLFAYFVCDEVIRADATGASRAASSNENSRHASPHGSAGASRHHRHPHTRHHNHQHGHSQQPGEDDDEDDHHNSSSSGNSTDSEMSDGANVLQYAPVLVAAAALVVAAEQVCLPLPSPLLRLLPQALAERLRFGCNEEATTRSPDPTSPLDPAPPLTAASARAGGAAVDPLRLTAQPADDNYAVLAELSVLLEAELLRLSASRRRLDGLLSPACEGEEEEEAAAAATAGGAFGASALLGHGKRGNTRCGAVRGSPSAMSPSSLSARADPYAVNLFGEVIGQVRAIHERSRESCPPVLLQRYQPLFREEI